MAHLVVLHLESMHDFFASDNQVHHACYYLAGRELTHFVADSKQVDEVHHCEELGLALVYFVEELEVELLLQVRQRLVHVFVPPLHEPLSPHHVSLEVVEVPLENARHPELHFVHLADRDRVVCALRKAFDVGRVDLLNLGSHPETCDPDQLELAYLDDLVAPEQKPVDHDDGPVEGLPLEAVVLAHLAQPVQQHQSHFEVQVRLQVKQRLLDLLFEVQY